MLLRTRPKSACFLAGVFAIKGDQKGFWSVTITGNWRLEQGNGESSQST